MKSCLLVLALVAAGLLTGCGHSNSDSNGSAPAVGTASNPREIDLTADDSMHYNTTSLEAKPGEYLKVVLTNVGNNPPELMAHNWVLLKPGSDYAAFASAAASQKDNKYIPPSLSDEIVAKIDLLGPRKSGEVDFQVPNQPGEYPFLCTFPGHYTMMHGTLTVK